MLKIYKCKNCLGIQWYTVHATNGLAEYHETGLDFEKLFAKGYNFAKYGRFDIEKGAEE